MRKIEDFEELQLFRFAELRFEFILAAASHRDLDDACALLQKQVGQTDGGLAGVHFSGEQGLAYAEGDFKKRLQLLMEYLAAEFLANRREYQKAIRMLEREVDGTMICLFHESPCGRVPADPIEDYGFEPYPTGGGCMALVTTEKLAGGEVLMTMITDLDGMAIPSAEEIADGNILIGLTVCTPEENLELFTAVGADLSLMHGLLQEEPL